MQSIALVLDPAPPKLPAVPPAARSGTVKEYDRRLADLLRDQTRRKEQRKLKFYVETGRMLEDIRQNSLLPPGFTQPEDYFEKRGGVKPSQQDKYLTVFHRIPIELAEELEPLGLEVAYTLVKGFKLDAHGGALCYLPPWVEEVLLAWAKERKLKSRNARLLRPLFLGWLVRQQTAGVQVGEEEIREELRELLGELGRPTVAQARAMAVALGDYLRELGPEEQAALRADQEVAEALRPVIGRRQMEREEDGPEDRPVAGPDPAPEDRPVAGRDPDPAPEEHPAAEPDPDPDPEDRPATGPDPAPRPPRLSHTQQDVPVPYPPVDRPPSQLERIACCMIIAMTQALTLALHMIRLRIEQFQRVYPRLAYSLSERIDYFREATAQVRPLLVAPAAAGRARLEELGRQTAPGDLFLSVRLDDGAALPMAWFSYQVVDPLRAPDCTDLEECIWVQNGLLDYLDGALVALLRALRTSDPLSPVLAYQLDSAWAACDWQLCDMAGTLSTPILLGIEVEREHQAEREQRLLELEKKRADMLMLGENGVPTQYSVMAITADGHLMGLTQNTPQFLIVNGRQGGGKSHILHLIVETCGVPEDGLAEMIEPPRTIRFSSDTSQGVTGDQLRACYYENEDPEQWEYLAKHYGVAPRGLVLQNAGLLVLPQSLADIRARYPDLLDRGVAIEPFLIDPSELGLFGYQAYLDGGAAGQKAQSLSRGLVASIIGFKGEDALPEVIEREIKKTRMDHRVKDAMLMKLRELHPIVKKGCFLIDKLQQHRALHIHIEGIHIGPKQVGPLQVAAANALSRPLRDGTDPHRWQIHDEGNLDTLTEVSGASLLERGSLLRHRTTSHGLAVQRMTPLLRRLAPLTTVYIQMNTPSEEEFRAAQRAFGALHGVDYHRDVRTLRDGTGLVTAVRANDRRAVDGVVPVAFRPSILDVKGATFRAV